MIQVWESPHIQMSFCMNSTCMCVGLWPDFSSKNVTIFHSLELCDTLGTFTDRRKLILLVSVGLILCKKCGGSGYARRLWFLSNKESVYPLVSLSIVYCRVLWHPMYSWMFLFREVKFLLHMLVCYALRVTKLLKYVNNEMCTKIYCCLCLCYWSFTTSLEWDECHGSASLVSLPKYVDRLQVYVLLFLFLFDLSKILERIRVGNWQL